MPITTQISKARAYWLDKWWRTNALLLVLLVAVFYCGLFEIHTNAKSIHVVTIITLVVAAFALLMVLVSFIYQLFKRRWGNAVCILIALGLNAACAVMGLIFLFLEAQSQPDTFSRGLKIPPNIKISEPMGIQQIDLIIATHPTTPDLLLGGSVMQQGGRYQFAFLYPKIDKGVIYLKAFEVTKNQPLSAEDLAKESMMSIYNPSDSITVFTKEVIFTIYEGNFKEYYAARFEVWYKPNAGGPERKLFEKNFKIEGWQR